MPVEIEREWNICNQGWKMQPHQPRLQLVMNTMCTRRGSSSSSSSGGTATTASTTLLLASYPPTDSFWRRVEDCPYTWRHCENSALETRYRMYVTKALHQQMERRVVDWSWWAYMYVCSRITSNKWLQDVMAMYVGVRQMLTKLCMSFMDGCHWE